MRLICEVKEIRINMEANAKLLKKKRIAHLGGKMSKPNCDEPKLPPDDFVYNIMKDMDSSKVVSYQQSQEVVSRKRNNLSFNDERQRNSNTQDCYYNKQAKKVLPKKSFPLMKKCQTSLKYLNKNICIPKPRAHVGFVPKPQVKPVCYAEQNASKFEYGNSSKVSKPKKIQSKAYSKILQSGSLKNKVPDPKSYEKNESSSFVADNEVDCHLSSTDDDDAAFENFVQNAVADDNDSTDSDSRFIIHRKKSRNKSKQKKKKQRSKSFSDNENSKHVPKVTSIPLSDSSESESNDTFEKINKSLKRKTDSPKGVQKRVCKGALEYCDGESLSDPPSYNNYYSSDADEDFGVHATTLNKKNEVASNVNIDYSNVNSESNSKLSNVETVTEHQLNHNLSSNPANLNSIESKAMNDTDISDSDGLLSYCSELTKSVPKYKMPCYVQLKRDPILDKKALTFYSATNSSEDDCILISEDSDTDEVSTTSHFTTSSAIDKTCVPSHISRDAQNKGEEIQNSNFNDSQSCEDAEIDDCVIMCEMPQVVLKNINESNGESKSLNSESLSYTAESNSNIQNLSTNIEILNKSENTKPDTVNKISELDNEQLLNPNKTDSASFCHENGSENIDEFNIQIVAVKSLVELSPNTFETNAGEVNEIEVIDLSDDDLMENGNSEVVKKLDLKYNSNISIQNEKAIQPNLTEIKSPEHNNKTCDPSEDSTMKEQNLPDPKIMEILNTINFDCIKEVINKTKLVDTACEAETSNSVLPTLSGPTTIRENRVENAISTNIEAVKECGTYIDKSVEDVDSSDSPSKSLKNVGLVKLPDGSIKSSCINSFKNTMESSSNINLGNLHNINLSFDKGKTALMTKSTSNNTYVEENISTETTFQMANAENRIVYNSDQESKAALNLKAASENSLHNYIKTNAVYDTDICNSLKTTEVPKKSVPNNKKQQNYQNAIETVPRQTNIIKEVDTIRDAVNALKHENISAAKYKINIKEGIKCEILENPSDDLDVIASTFIQDLNPPNKKVLSLLNLYKTEYAKYMQIKNTEVNVSAGLKLLHDNQVKKLLHLRSSMKNLVKHDPCFYKVAQENSIIKRENKLKHSEVLPIGKKNARPASSSKEEVTTHTEMGTDQSLKIDSAGTSRENVAHENCIVKRENEVKHLEILPVGKKNASLASSSKEEGTTHTEIGTDQSLKIDSAGTSRENLLRLMMNMKCAQCGKTAAARCQGCAKVYYCSPRCGELSWIQGHSEVCKRS